MRLPLLLFVIAVKQCNGVVYNHSDGVQTFDTQLCQGRGGTDAGKQCVLNDAVLSHNQRVLDMGISHNSASAHVCNFQANVCGSIEANQNLSPECSTVYGGCRSALRHLHKMMFNEAPSPQICNNFARKSIRGFFHDFMSNAIDGSILSEHDVSMNFGLCRWAQYINVLSDETGCDSGSIIAMAGELGYKACGVEIWDLDVAVQPTVTLNRPQACGANIAASPIFDDSIKQRKEAFSDLLTASSSTAMEEFWYALNGHTHAKPDGEVEYSAEAGAAAHAIGRVTCEPDGVGPDGRKININMGFFHKARANGRGGGTASPTPAPVAGSEAFYQEAIDHIRETQCRISHGEKEPSGGVRIPTTKWPHVAGETNFNGEGGFCGMPTQFLGTVTVGGLHRTPRWVQITEHSSKAWPPYSSSQSSCRTRMKMYIPHELLTIASVTAPSSTSLTQFEGIAWDGYDSVASQWDSCEVGCAIPILENRLCGGTVAGGATRLQAYNWNDPYCNDGIQQPGGYACCPTACGQCTQDTACSGRGTGCCPATVSAAARECESSWDVNCLVPKTGDGGVCALSADCKHDMCKDGRCCNTAVNATKCAKCGPHGGNCVECAAGFKFMGTECVPQCQCTPGCIDCDCGVCKDCDSASYLNGTDCIAKVLVGASCTADDQCTSGSCIGNNCAHPELLPGCIDCNSRGLCTACAENYTLCGWRWADSNNPAPYWSGSINEGQSQCKPTIYPTTAKFKCGTGGVGTDFPSSDGFDYCGAPYCPCTNCGCWCECDVPYTCWVGGKVQTLSNPLFVPSEFQSMSTEVIQWSVQQYAARQVALGTHVKFQYGSAHNVYLLANAEAFGTCSFTGATLLGDTSAGSGDGLTWVPPANGVYYIACNVGEHCASGMKIEIVVGDTQGVQLQEGWSWISFYRISSDMSIGTTIRGIFNDGDIIKSSTAFSQYYATQGVWFGTLKSLDVNKAYLFKSGQARTLEHAGTPVSLPSSVPITSGWNWIPAHSPSPRDILALEFSGIVAGDILKSQTSFTQYYENSGWFGPLGTLAPSQGYKLKATAAGTVKWPA